MIPMKPPEISRVTALLWASLVVELIKLPVDWSYRRTLASAASIVFHVGLTFAIVAFLIWKTGQGKNWARVTLLVLFAIGLLPFLWIVHSEFGRSSVLGVISIAQIALQASALFLIFTDPGKAFFRAIPARPHS